MLKAPPVLVVQAPVSSANKLITLSNQTLLPSSTTAAVTQLPYHYSEFENLFVCNLCNFTYDSLRSIKAHIWKHSGHHDLSYPILDLNNNNNNINKTTNSFSKKQINDSIAITSNNLSISKPSSNVITSTNNSSSSSSLFNVNNNTNANANSGNSGGICSVLLEVIEKLRDEESSSVTNTPHNKMAVESSIISEQTAQSKRKCKRSLKIGSLNCKRLINKAKLKIRRHINNKKLKRKELFRKLKQKSKTLRQIKSDTFALKKNSEKEPVKECKIETSVLNSLFDDDATILNNKDIYETYDFYFKTLSRNSVSTSSPSSSSSSSSSSSLSPKSYENCLKSNDINGVLNSDLFCLLSSLANNDGHDEQYVCGLCSYVCYHLPSLKSHMWSHVKSLQFDYSVNTSIINAALDYENKLNRKLNLIRKATMENFDMSGEKDTSNSLNRNIYMHRQLSNALELINYPQEQIEKLTAYQANKSSPMVSFRCSRCNFESIDLSVLRLHKREHIK